MSLQTLTCVVAACDGCRQAYGVDHDDVHFDDVDSARECVTEDGWVVVRSRLLCADCAEACRLDQHAWRQLTAPPGVFGVAQALPQPFAACARCELVCRDLDVVTGKDVR